MKISLKGKSRKELEKLAADVDKALKKLAKDDMKKAIDAAEKAAKAHGFSLAEISGSPAKKAPAKKKPVKKVPPKYAHPENPELTWTGRGRRPLWVNDVTNGGKDLDKILIKK